MAAEDDETVEVHRRFLREGLDYYAIPDGEKVLHVWCWLADAETNCLSLRHQLDKLRRQQEEEMKEVEEYVEHIWKLSSQKIAQLEAENKQLQEQLDRYHEQDVSRALIKEVQQLLIDERLVDLASLGLKQQVSLLLAERAQLKRDLENLENERQEELREGDDPCGNFDDEGDLEPHAATIQQERRRSSMVASPPTPPLMYKVCDLPKNAHHVYAKNKPYLSTFDDEHQRFQTNSSQDNVPKNVTATVTTGNNNNDASALPSEELDVQCQHHQKQIQQQSEKIRMLEKVAKQLELDNETLRFKLSEALAELDEMEDQMRTGRGFSRKGSVPRHSISSVSSGKLELLQSYLDTKLSSAHQELSLVDQLQKLHGEIGKLQDQLLSSGRQLERLAIKYQQRKARHKERIQRLRTYLEHEQKKWKEQIEAMEHKLLLTEDALQKQKDWCTKVESVRYFLQEEKRKLCEKLLLKEEQIRMKEHENLILLQRLQRFREIETALTH